MDEKPLQLPTKLKKKEKEKEKKPWDSASPVPTRYDFFLPLRRHGFAAWEVTEHSLALHA
jgi:hypothetical protein